MFSFKIGFEFCGFPCFPTFSKFSMTLEIQTEFFAFILHIWDQQVASGRTEGRKKGRTDSSNRRSLKESLLYCEMVGALKRFHAGVARIFVSPGKLKDVKEIMLSVSKRWN